MCVSVCTGAFFLGAWWPLGSTQPGRELCVTDGRVNASPSLPEGCQACLLTLSCVALSP